MDNDDRSLLEEQDALQVEAASVERDLDLESLFEPIGRPVRVGSAALGLMVRCDLDVTVICPKLDKPSVLQVGCHLANHPRVRQVLFRDDTGHWKTERNYPDGLYLGLKYLSPVATDWNVDIWFVDEPRRQPDLALVQSLPPQLNADVRTSILRIKAAWSAQPEYGRSVRSVDIYTAVLDDGVRSIDQFEVWLAARPIR